MHTREYQVTGMSCGGCESSVHEAVSQISGIDGVDVSADRGRLVVTAEGQVDDRAVIGAVEAAGYQASPA
ncbi:heavy-metal-associated domain-containing protein [Yaniella halotolerans]|uniref:heavy-metal-associated domain-containing protein n=1 Tax=Yaniella halotolerans TaxID=225453 RepID=UPI0003B667A3|nr:heavy metal-associated domain-containing protein [Yaniella halotolerans]